MDYLQRYEFWKTEAPLTVEEKAQLEAMTGDDERKGSFGAELHPDDRRRDYASCGCCIQR